MKRCAYCDGPATSVDHVWPRSRGGDNHPNNLVASCRRCNSAKASRSLLDDDCPRCATPHAPGDVNTATQRAYYACRCGNAWATFWDLQRVPLLTRVMA